MAVGSFEHAGGTDAQVAGTGVGLGAVRRLHCDPAGALYGDVEVAAGLHQDAGAVVEAEILGNGIGAGCVAGAVDRLGAETVQVGAEVKDPLATAEAAQ